MPALAPSATLEAAAVAFARVDGEALAVVGDGRLVGVVLRDDVAAAQPSAATTLAVGELRGALGRIGVARLVRTDLPAIAPETPIAEAARLLRDGAPALVVVEGGRFVGVLGAADVLGALEGLA